MKKLLLPLFIVGLIAAGCNSQKTENTALDTATQSENNLSNSSKPNNSGSIYTNSELRFEIFKPIKAKVVSETSDHSSGGRAGEVVIEENKESVDIHAYTTFGDLQKDFSDGSGATTDSLMKSLGLTKTTVNINGKSTVVYYGDHIADVPGGGDSWSYVAAEIVGPTYSYMIEFNNISKDPNDPRITQYLNSFMAK